MKGQPNRPQRNSRLPTRHTSPRPLATIWSKLEGSAARLALVIFPAGEREAGQATPASDGPSEEA